MDSRVSSTAVSSAHGSSAQALHDVTNPQLLARLRAWMGAEREAMAEVVVHLLELDRRKLWAIAGHASLFSYCVRELGYSECEAFRRIRVARLAAAVPSVVEALRSGQVHLSGLSALAPVLTPANAEAWLARVAGRSKRVIEAMVAAAQPAAAEPESRRLHARPIGSVDGRGDGRGAGRGAGEPGTDGAPADDLEPEALLYRFTFEASGALLEKFEQARALLSHAVPDGNAEVILGRALDLLIARTKKRRFASTGAEEEDSSREESAREESAREESARQESARQEHSSREESAPQESTQEEPKSPARGRSRYIPAEVRRQVYERDEGRCAYIGPDGTCCDSRHALEYHHCRAWGRGGGSEVENVELRCRTHNGLASLFEYGPELAEYWRRKHEQTA